MPSFHPLYNLFLSASDKGSWTYQEQTTESSIFLIKVYNIRQIGSTKAWLNSYLQIREYFSSLNGELSVEGNFFNLFPSLETKSFKIEVPYTIPSLNRYLQVRYMPKRTNKFKASVKKNVIGGYTAEGQTNLPYFDLDRFDVEIYEWR